MSGVRDADVRRTEPMRWWHIAPATDLEREVFGDTAWSAAQFWSELARENRRYRVLLDRDEVVGYAGLATTPPDADVQTLAVAPRLRGQGWGARLLDQLVDMARETGCTRLLLEVAADNRAAVALYERSGFDAIARRSSYYAPGRDAIIMRRDLGRASSDRGDSP